jgi:hypothetical protein
MPHNIYLASDGINDRGDIFRLAFERIVLSVAAIPTPATVHDVHAEVRFKRRLHLRPRGVVAGGSMH